jgi:cytochrome c-type biogenesis protein CcmH
VFGMHTLLLWLTPLLVLGLGALGLGAALRRRPAPAAPLDETERAALVRILRESERRDPA